MRLCLLACLLFGCGTVRAADWLPEVTPAAAAGIVAASRENLSAILQRRSRKDNPTVAAMQKYGNGVVLAIFRNGAPVAAGEALDGELPNNIYLAANRAVYNAPVDDLDRCAVFVSILGKGTPEKRTMAPFHLMLPGQEAYAAEYQGQKAFVGPLEPVIRGWNWRQTLLELVRRVTAGAKPPVKEADFLQIAASPEFTLTSFPCDTFVSPAKTEADLRFIPGLPATTVAMDGTAIRQSLLNALAWFRANQSATGEFPLRTDPSATAAPKSAKPADRPESAEDLTVVAYSAFALGELWHVLNQPEARLCGLRALDGLWIGHYLDNPQTGNGYIKQKDGIPLGASALTLLAVRNLDAAKGNSEIAANAEKLAAFCLSLRNADGTFRPWLQPADATEGSRVFPAMAINALLSWDGEKHSAPLLLSMERYRLLNTAVAGAQPPAYAVNWLTGAAARVYGVTRKNMYAEWALGMNIALAGDWLVKHRVFSEEEHSAADAGLVLSSLSEALYLQKILPGQDSPEGRARLGLLQRGALDATRTLLALQIRDDATCLLLPDSQKFLGAFRRSPGELGCSLRDMAFATAGLCRAMSVLTAADFAGAK